METPLRGRDDPAATRNERPGNTPACAGKGDTDPSLTSYTVAAPPLNARGSGIQRECRKAAPSSR
jgi:hypothetical protein